MGRIKTQFIKSITRQLLDIYPDKFSTGFEQNKELVEQYTDSSKKLRNIIAGYITRLQKKGEE